MDYSSLPNIIALAVLLFNYRPLMHRSGSPTNFWFYGWCFALLNSINRFLAGPASLGSSGVRLAIATATLECGGLAFLMGSANRVRWLVGWKFALTLAVGPLVQSALLLLPSSATRLAMPVSVLLYLLPAVFVAMHRPWNNRPANMVAGGFAIFALASFPVMSQPLVLRAWAILLIFTSAAYLCFRTSLRLDRANLTTALGLLLWGIKYPVLYILGHTHPEVMINRGLLQVPEYCVLAGSVLSMMEERLNRAERMATHDALTNLPNRRFLQDRFEEALDEARAARTTIACLVIDVDDFKTINDTRGHGAGDAILRAIAVRLAWHLSPRDVLARTGGDEFTAMLAGVSNEHYLRFIAEAMMSAASVPVQVEGEPVEVSISMGIALSPDDADEIDDLVRLADDAMYRAKRRGGNVLAFASDTAAPEALPLKHGRTGQLLQMAAPARPTAVRSVTSAHASEY